ncbi:hypothetical protein D9758_013635 [Tetrapyrgos nigripes]|uniref:Brr2 N-terminal helicase PWI domain-containing protein n=1 Tax=Tetrapyrgos nigripes TaxID=182062 RepID=A0A8H5FQI2_9AGAR|nr:hypothetical protein D9758_013635 [Tetrapyrgos nigripes]
MSAAGEEYASIPKTTTSLLNLALTEKSPQPLLTILVSESSLQNQLTELFRSIRASNQINVEVVMWENGVGQILPKLILPMTTSLLLQRYAEDKHSATLTVSVSEVYLDPVTAPNKAASVFSVLGSESSIHDCENQLMELFEYQSFHVITKFFKNCDLIVWCTKLMRSDADEQVNVEVAMREKGVGWILRELELVSEELVKICHNCTSTAISELLRERLGPTSEYIQSLIDIQAAYINTNHPAFIQSSALASAQANLPPKSQAIPPRPSSAASVQPNGLDDKDEDDPSDNDSSINGFTSHNDSRSVSNTIHDCSRVSTASAASTPTLNNSSGSKRPPSCHPSQPQHPCSAIGTTGAGG